LIFGGRVVSW